MRLNAIQVGNAIKDLGFEQHRTRDGRFWIVKERPVTDIGNFYPTWKIYLKTLTINKIAVIHYPFSCR